MRTNKEGDITLNVGRIEAVRNIHIDGDVSIEMNLGWGFGDDGPYHSHEWGVEGFDTKLTERKISN